MFNLKQAKDNSIQTRLKNDNIGPSADDKQPIAEKVLPHRSKKPEMVTTEKQMDSVREATDDVVIEKALNAAKGKRSDAGSISVPPINVLVEKLRQNRLKSDFKDTKESGHWSLDLGNPALPGHLEWPSAPSQHDHIVLGNDPRRFEPVKNMPVNVDRAKNDAARGKAKDPKALLGGITTADMDRLAHMIHMGESIDYDTAIVAILREADKEERELTPVERKAVSDLKIARTRALLQK